MARTSRKQVVLSEVEISKELAEKRMSSLVEAVPAAAYVRLSVEDDESQDSIETQIALVRNYIESQPDLKYVDTYADNGYTGTNFDRPAFTQLMEDVRKKKIKCIVVKDLSRFGRNYTEAGYYIETIFPFLGVRMIAITDHFDSDRGDEANGMIVPIKNIVNSMYAKDISKKVFAAHQSAMERGTPILGKAPYGYILNHKTGDYEVDPVAAFYVKLIFYWKLQGISVGEIANRLNAIDAPTPRKRMEQLGMMKKEVRGEWSTSSITKMFEHEEYIGNLVVNKTKQALYMGEKKRNTDRSEWVIFENHHEAIIAKDDFEKCRYEFDNNAKKKAEKKEIAKEIAARFPNHFEGIIYCGNCGQYLHYDRRPHGYTLEKKHNFYICSGSTLQGKSCGKINMNEKLLQMIVMRQINQYLMQLVDGDKILKECENASDRTTVLGKINADIISKNALIQEISDKRRKLYMDFTAQKISIKEYKDLRGEMNQTYDALNEELETLLKEKDSFGQKIEEYHNTIQSLCNFHGIEGFDPDLVKALVERIDVFPDKKIQITYKVRDLWKELQSDGGESCDSNL